MDIYEFVVPTAVATLIATIVAALFQAYLTNRASHDFAKRLETHKTELAERLAARSRLVERRLLAYPQLVELVYRTRNLARDLLVTQSPRLFEEFNTRRREIEDTLYKYRLDLERDHLFDITHNFKNVLAAFAASVEQRGTGSVDVDDVQMFYKSIDDIYEALVGRISAETGGA